MSVRMGILASMVPAPMGGLAACWARAAGARRTHGICADTSRECPEASAGSAKCCSVASERRWEWARTSLHKPFNGKGQWHISSRTVVLRSQEVTLDAANPKRTACHPHYRCPLHAHCFIAGAPSLAVPVTLSHNSIVHSQKVT